MRVALFVAFLLAALAYAVWRGGGPERTMAGIALIMVGSDVVLHHFVPVEFAALDTGHLIIDLFGATSTILLALCAHRCWPMFVAVLHTLPLLAHTSRFLDVTMHPAAYLTMQVASSWLVPPILILATWRHRQRLRRTVSDPSWQASWHRWIPTTARS